MIGSGIGMLEMSKEEKMSKAMIIYDPKFGNTEMVAKALAEELKNMELMLTA
jgi:flavorubredoxin